MSRKLHATIAIFSVLLFVGSAFGVQPSAFPPNADPVYQQVRKPLVGDAFSVSNVTLKRDAGLFTFTSGTLCFVKPVNGKVTGAVFSGDGRFELTPPTAFEKKSLSYLTKEEKISEEFHELGLRFGDDTYEILKGGSGITPATGGCAAGILDDMYNAQKSKFHTNFAGRILEDVLNQEERGAFFAFIKGKRYNGKLLYIVDPHGVNELELAPEEVVLFTYDENKFGVWSSFHLESEYRDGTARSDQRNAWFHIDKQDLDIGFEKSGKLSGTATTTLTALVNGLRVVPLKLYPTLRISAVTLGDGAPINFIQEDKNDDPDYFAILPKAAAKGEAVTIKTAYSGKDAVQNEGGGNYYISGGARESWYPNNSWYDYVPFTMRFTFPKDLKLVATGKPTGERQENGMNVATWESEQPLTVACFQFGRFKREQKVLQRPSNFTVETYANVDMPDDIRALQHAVDGSGVENGPGGSHASMYAFGNFNTTSMAQKALAEAEVSEGLYNDYFGPIPFTRLAITQQTAMGYGQSWPGLVWLPMSYFYDSTVRHQLHMDDPKGYFTVVGPHEIAHQWWGHTVTWASYRDQWMSEGFSDFSASLFLQVIEKNPQKFIHFWNDQRELLTEKNKEGFRAIDVGPLTMGYRLNNTKTGNITRRLIYPKGSYVLHMIRMMMWSSKDGDARFKEMMHDFVKSYYNKPASTEDFKAMVEKHMLGSMNVTGDNKMDWFFDPFVYGTALPNYKFTYNVFTGDKGPVMDFHLAQSNVTDDFKMVVPIYLELANGRIVRLGSTLVAGNNTKTERVDLGALGLKEMPKRVLINYYNDVLSTSN